MEYAIEIENLTKHYPGFSLQNVSFAVPRGSVVGFVGENGAGKTTTIKSILNIVHPDGGTVRVLGQPSTADARQVHSRVGVVFDECSFSDILTAEQVGRMLAGIHKTWDAPYYAALLDRFGLAGRTGKNKIIKTYSHGMKRKLCLAAALAHRPQLLILDEATSGLDPVVRDEILSMFLEFIQDEDHSILFSSHITTDIQKAADYVVFLHQGQVVLDAEKDELMASYGLVRCTEAALGRIPAEILVGSRRGEFGTEALVSDRARLAPAEDLVVDNAAIDDIMLYTIRGKSA